MISHTTLGTNNLDKAGAFYFEILNALGGTQIYKSDTVIFWEFEEGSSKLALTVPFDGELATNGNGTMVAFTLNSTKKVDEVFLMALKLGATSEGGPGERNGGAYYGAYFRDLDGNKIAIFHR
ncbi:VOC family protein [Thalassotalea fonticola]|uniref:VOC family protein n=1 Tax=Thalassotalea fonticola TaxID=3065649 RepID=A0ABZ0GKX7_9GAMM|nr:VOC family protein [Colwelliaceae bacterium S1-1]